MKESKDMNLLPCAHCGSESVRLIRNVVDSAVYWNVECSDCGIRTLPYEEDDVTLHADVRIAMDDAIVCAVEAWNTRPNAKHCDVPASARTKSMYINARSITNQMNSLCNELKDCIER